ncbi:MAG: M23 family metallopeptidase, partial [Planctomycetes bacterium]|nr:M23 family metallopeptidase [Planctomycetota bacterium]
MHPDDQVSKQPLLRGFHTYLLLFFLSASTVLGRPEDSTIGTLVTPPPSTAEYRQPVKTPALILQANGGWFTHSDPISQYAWDYNLRVGSTVVAARAGVVSYIRMNSNIGGADLEHYQNEANSIVIDHLDGTCAQYYHLSKEDCPVRLGEYVIQGEPIALSGDTGYNLGPHLHFAVLDAESMHSLPARFIDFNKNQGVPQKDDLVHGAAPAEVSSKIITQYKQVWRACHAAQKKGYPDLAFRFASALPESVRHPFYFYDRELTALKKKLRKNLIERLSLLSTLTDPSEAELLESLRMLITLEEIRDWELRRPFNKLKEQAGEWPGEPLDPELGDHTAIEDWTEGLALECVEQTRDAALRYISAYQRSRGLVKSPARASLARILEETST